MNDKITVIEQNIEIISQEILNKEFTAQIETPDGQIFNFSYGSLIPQLLANPEIKDQLLDAYQAGIDMWTKCSANPDDIYLKGCPTVEDSIRHYLSITLVRYAARLLLLQKMPITFSFGGEEVTRASVLIDKWMSDEYRFDPNKA